MVATIRSISSTGNAGKYFYFTESNFESSQSWVDSKGKSILGLGPLQRKDFENMLDGKFITKDCQAVELGRKENGELKHHPGQELIFSAPKSVSIMALIAEDKRIIAAHDRAVEAVIGYIEDNMIYTRVQKNGILRLEKTDNLIAARYTHLTARPAKNSLDQQVDPQVHSHTVIANATECADGQWRSIVFDKLYENKMHLGELYRIELAHEIRGLGYQIDLEKDKSDHWSFEIRGVSNANIQEFSRRRAGIMEVAKELGHTSAAQLAIIAKNTREDKVGYTKEELQQNWRGRATGLDALLDLKNNAILPEIPLTALKLEGAISYAIEYLSEREAVFTQEQLVARIVEQTGADFKISDMTAALKQTVKQGFLLKSPNNQNNFTTVKAVKAEKACIAMMQKEQAVTKAIMNPRDIDLSGVQYIGQKNAVELVLTSRDRIIGIQGSAGTGKTTVLKQIKQLAATRDYKLMGLAPTKSAANTMTETAQIESQTLQLFLIKYSGVIAGRGTQIALAKMKESFSRQVIVLDEASLTSTDQINGLIKLAAKLNFKVVMLGDVKQLGSVTAGKPFYYLQEHGMNTVVMNTIMRQQNDNLLKSVYNAEEAIDGNQSQVKQSVYQSLKAVSKDNIVDLGKRCTNQELADSVYQKWLEHYRDGKDTLVVVPSNPLRKQVNSLIREHYIAGSEIHHEILVSKAMGQAQLSKANSYTEGDVMVFIQDHHEHHIKKGDVCDVIKANNQSLFIKNHKNTIEISINKIAKKIELYQRELLPLAVGDRIKWTKNSISNSAIVNGSTAIIKEVKERHMLLEFSNGQVKKIKRDDSDLKYVDHDYSATVHSAQGKTVDYVIGVGRAKEEFLDLTNQRSFYVTVSRARKGATLILDDYKQFIKSLSVKSGAKTSAIEQQRLEKFKDGTPYSLSETRTEALAESHSANIKFTPNQKIDYDSRYNEFIASPSLIHDTALSVFGELNRRLSNHDQLRFGNKGSISVNLRTGQWHDFSAGAGGSLFKAYKENNLAFTQGSHVTLKAAKSSDKTKSIVKILDQSISLQNDKQNVAIRYLKEHRRIDIDSVNLSQDLRFTQKIWSSEDGKYHPALIAVARDASAQAKATQVIYLDAGTANKNKGLAINKRSIGTLKGSHVELTNNIAAQEIFIAEGIETGLSIAKSYPKARVICSLGISNIKNIELGRQEHVTICADNDGHDSHTNLVIERAAQALKAKGIKSIAIVRPKAEKQDFNDVLKEYGTQKIRSDIDPILNQSSNYQARINSIHQKLKDYRTEEQALQKVCCLEVYKDKKKALAHWDKLVQENGIRSAINIVSNDPTHLSPFKGMSFLSMKSNTRIKAIQGVAASIKELTNISIYQKLIRHNQTKLLQVKQALVKRYAKHLDQVNGLDLVQLEQRLEKGVAIVLNEVHSIRDFEHVRLATQNLAEQIINYQHRYQKSPDAIAKNQFLMRSCFEQSRRSALTKILEAKYPEEKSNHSLSFINRLERLLKIDSRNQDHNNSHKIEDHLAALARNDNKIKDLTAENIKKGIGHVKSHFIATEVIKHQERYGVPISLNQLNNLKTIGNYVEHHFNILQKSGYSKKEASIAYNEGARLMHYADAGSKSSLILKSEVSSVQKCNNPGPNRKQYVTNNVRQNQAMTLEV